MHHPGQGLRIGRNRPGTGHAGELAFPHRQHHTKTFTGNLVLQLVDQGWLSLDDPVSKFVEGIPDGGLITVRMLLNHSSGLFNYGGDVTLNEAIAADPHKVWTPEELVAAGVSNPPTSRPARDACTPIPTTYCWG